nr:unnamed protein product [Digitaria exilis]
MESGHKSGGGSAAAGGGAGGGDGVLCHACGYQYPNGHPSAKQRRAHRKHCAKPASSPAAAAGGEEHDGSEPLPGEGHGGVGLGGGIGASAAECGGGSPRSVPEGTKAVEGGDSAEHYPGNGTGHQVTGDKCAEGSLNSSSTDGATTLTTVATQYSEKGSPIEDGNLSDAAVGSEQLEGAPTSVPSPEPEDGAKSSFGISEHEIQSSLPEYETQNSTVVPLESNATGGGTSEKADDVVSQSQVDGGIVVTEGDGLINTIGKDKFSEEKSVEGDEVDLSCQDNIQTEIGEGHSNAAMEEGPSDKNPNAIHSEEIRSDETETKQQSKHVLADSFEKIPNIEVSESATVKSVGADDVLPGLSMDGSQLETPDDVKPQQELDSTSETSEGSISAISSVFGPAVGGTANITENVCSSGSTMDDNMQKNVTGDSVVPSQVDLVELSTSTTELEINMVDNTNDNEKGQNGKGGTDVTSYGGNELHIIENFEEKQQNKELMVDSIPHQANTVFGADNHGENEQNKEVVADMQSMTSAEEKEQIEEFIANLAPEETAVTGSRDIVEEKQGEIDIKTNGETDGAHSIETAGENNAAATPEVNAGTTTDDAEDVAQNEKFTTPISHGINMVCSSVNEVKMHNEELTEGLGSHENVVVHGTDNVEEKTIEETKTDATSPKFSLVTSTVSVEERKTEVTSTVSIEERKDEETTADPTLHERSAVHSADNNDEKKNEDPISNPTTTLATICSIGDVEEKKQSEETTEDPSSGESNTLPVTNDEENTKQILDTAATGPASDNTEVGQTTSAVEVGNPEDTASKEISTIESMDDLKAVADQNEDIADKEMVIDSDKNHVSLKVLLADKNVETKEKEKKTTTKDRVLSFRRRASKDSVSPVKPGSPKAVSGQQDWNSPARLPVEKKPKGRKQQWVPFICCSSVQ